ncbi:hypothetical protein [Kamptonema sp. UHCC 0994]|uniref:hypothetical protein n=1 Tax=Kamptonema sp. UHCC 0994 TaxID=3031329 RepID=UPI0023B9B29F|nr:hypothetical protein [Kamptonema sp. UHCC 0994]MDF0554908.1 hypothetical protein [Kamptonema sp. UHCC 0994]
MSLLPLPDSIRDKIEGVAARKVGGFLRLPLNDILSKSISQIASKAIGSPLNFRDILKITGQSIFDGTRLDPSKIDISDPRSFLGIAQELGVKVPPEYEGYIGAGQSILAVIKGERPISDLAGALESFGVEIPNSLRQYGTDESEIISILEDAGVDIPDEFQDILNTAGQIAGLGGSADGITPIDWLLGGGTNSNSDTLLNGRTPPFIP